MPKIDSKQVLANERTYLNWLHMSVVTGGVAAGASDQIKSKFPG